MRQLIIAVVAVLLAVGMLFLSLAAVMHLSAVVGAMPSAFVPALILLGNLLALYAIVATVIRRKRRLGDA